MDMDIYIYLFSQYMVMYIYIYMFSQYMDMDIWMNTRNK